MRLPTLTMNDYFSHLIGQDNVKKKLNFYLKAYQATSVCPFLNLVGAKGLGKTLFAKEFAKNLKNKDGSKRPFLELNCSQRICACECEGIALHQWIAA